MAMMKARFLTAHWRYLAMLNYEMDPRVLSPYVPAGTEIDRWNGQTMVSIVGFLFLNTRVFGCIIPGYRNFEEVNLRFYVKRRLETGEWRRGVVFIREIVPKRLIAFVARRFYNENYIALPMQHRIDMDADTLSKTNLVTYEWITEAGKCSLILKTKGQAHAVLPGSEEEFITEHYWGYSAMRDGSSLEYHVDHPKWQIWQAQEAMLLGDLQDVYAKAFVPFLSGKPRSAFLADGSEVIVRLGSRI